MLIGEKFIKELLQMIDNNEDIKTEFKKVMKPFIEVLLKDIYPYIYLSLAFVLITFVLILGIFIFLLYNHNNRKVKIPYL
jgi:hypothetical protein